MADKSVDLVIKPNGTLLRISKLQAIEPAPFAVHGWEVDDIHERVDELVARGVAFER